MIAKKARVLYPGCALTWEDRDRKRGDGHGRGDGRGHGSGSGDGEVASFGCFAEKSIASMARKSGAERGSVPFKPPLIIWNHRWEFDKKPEVFFHALKEVKAARIPFRLALLGERFTAVPEIFHGAMRDFEHEIVISGHVESRCDYIRWLKQGDLVVSTAIQENFGIAVVEAIRFGALPLLPQRLSYPEIIPERFHQDVLYSSFEGLVTMLKERLGDMEKFQGLRWALADAMGLFSWEEMIDQYDAAFEALFNANGAVRSYK
jgi:glycosyltransferase involved in cell wall biosynthesis